jgi:hypothetical protein
LKKKEQRPLPRSRSLFSIVAVAPNPRVLAKVAHELDGQTFTSTTDLKEAIKDLAVQYRLPFDGDSMTRALDLLERSRRPLMASLPELRRRRA